MPKAPTTSSKRVKTFGEWNITPFFSKHIYFVSRPVYIVNLWKKNRVLNHQNLQVNGLTNITGYLGSTKVVFALENNLYQGYTSCNEADHD